MIARRPLHPHGDQFAASGSTGSTPDGNCICSFWGDHRFLSNFFPVDLVFEGRVYPSVEHAYQAAKSLDGAVRAEIAALPRPGEAKRVADRTDVRPDWTDDLRIDVMSELISLKFETPDLAARLLDTGDAELVEGNNWGDTFWGAVDGEGENHLGRIMMAVRASLRSSTGANRSAANRNDKDTSR